MRVESSDVEGEATNPARHHIKASEARQGKEGERQGEMTDIDPSINQSINQSINIMHGWCGR